MDTCKSFITIILVSNIQWAETISEVYGSKKSCPQNARVELTADFQSANESYLRNSTWEIGNKTIGCPCDNKICIPLCCSLKFVRKAGECVEMPEDSWIREKHVPSMNDDGSKIGDLAVKDYHLYEDDPCDIIWMWSSVTEEYSVFKNGSILVPDYEYGQLSNYGQYCLTLDEKLEKYFVKVCRPWLNRGCYEIFCMIISIIIWLLIFIVYAILPELQNLHGLIFRCYIASDIAVYFAVVGIEFTVESRNHATLFAVFDIVVRVGGCSSALWSNVMNYNIWRSFRNMKFIDQRIKDEERKRFIWYAAYAWGCAVFAITSLYVVVGNVAYFREDTVGQNYIKWFCVVVVTTALFCNTVLQISIALNLRKYKKDTDRFANGVNKHHDQAEEQRFNLNFKLFTIAGAHMITWPIWLLWPYAKVRYVMATTEVAQGLLIFFAFIWKDNIRRSLIERFSSRGSVQPYVIPM